MVIGYSMVGEIGRRYLGSYMTNAYQITGRARYTRLVRPTLLYGVETFGPGEKIGCCRDEDAVIGVWSGQDGENQELEHPEQDESHFVTYLHGFV